MLGLVPRPVPSFSMLHSALKSRRWTTLKKKLGMGLGTRLDDAT